MSRIFVISSLVFLSMFVFVEVAQAELIRGGGRPTVTRDFDETVYYINDRYTNAAGVDTTAVEASDIPFVNSLTRRQQLSQLGAITTFNGDSNPLRAFPSGSECEKSISETELDTKNDRLRVLEDAGDSRSPGEEDEFNELVTFLDNFNTVDPCSWRFNQGENISVEGLFQAVLAGIAGDEVDYAVDWKINGESHGGEIGLVDGQGFAAVTLDKFIDLAPGDYTIEVSVTISSLVGSFFYENPGPENNTETPVELTETCTANPDFVSEEVFLAEYFRIRNITNPTQDQISDALDVYFTSNDVDKSDTVCGLVGVLQDSFSTDIGNQTIVNPRTFYMSFSETLTILATGQGDPSTAVNTPTTFGILLTGLAALGLRRRKTKKS